MSNTAISINPDFSTISAYWSGPKLGWMQLACLSSFALHGHEVILYTDNSAINVPDFITTQPIDTVWSQSELKHSDIPPVLASDIFRLKLFQSKDTIWADTDAYCTAPFQFSTPHIFGKLNGAFATGVLKLPSDSPVLRDMLDFALDGKDFPHWLSANRQAMAKEFDHLPPMERLLNFYNIKWGILGPNALTYYMRKHKIGRQKQQEAVFYPVNPIGSSRLFELGSMDVLDNPTTVSVHFYGRRVPLAVNKAKSNIFPAGSFAHFAYQETAEFWEHLL